ncbi:MAG: hypothetical protein VW840_18895, partial [Gammaproteobacteria bacterium]
MCQGSRPIFICATLHGVYVSTWYAKRVLAVKQYWALNLNFDFHMLYLNGVYDYKASFWPVKPPTIAG